MLAIVVTEAVLNKGTDFKEIHPLNMLAIVVTDCVASKGTDFKE